MNAAISSQAAAMRDSHSTAPPATSNAPTTGRRGPRRSMSRPMSGPAARIMRNRRKNAQPNVDELHPRSSDTGTMNSAKFAPARPTPTAPNTQRTPTMVHP